MTEQRRAFVQNREIRFRARRQCLILCSRPITYSKIISKTAFKVHEKLSSGKKIKWKLLKRYFYTMATFFESNESKIDNSNIDLNDYCHEATKIEMITKVSVHCDKLLNSIKGLNIHISKSHYDVHKKQITDKYVLVDSNNKDDSMKENNQHSQQTSLVLPRRL